MGHGIGTGVAGQKGGLYVHQRSPAWMGGHKCLQPGRKGAFQDSSVYIWVPFAETVGRFGGMVEIIRIHRRADASTSIFVSLRNSGGV